MKHSLIYLLVFVTIVSFFSCKKERSFENSANPAEASLISDVTGECLPKTVVGSYIEGTPLTDSNYMEVLLNVSTAGSYTISTDTSNGYSFKGTGTVAAAGLNMVRLKGAGTPGAAGTNLFVITFDSSFCLVQVVVLPSGAGGPAAFTLQGSGGSCSNATPAGAYVKAIPLAFSNSIDISVNVTAIGTYNISTAATNGMIFSKTGTFVATGAQMVTLTGTGTPVNEGATTITITAGASSCTFVVTVTAIAPPPLAGDYFPRTINSNWSYEFDDTPADSLLRKVISATHSALGNTYNIFIATDDAAAGFDSSGYFRKSSGDYFEYVNIGDFFTFDNPVWIEYVFLKDDQPAGFSWTTNSISGSISSIPVTIRIKLTILQKDIAVTVNGIAYSNTIVVEQKFETFIGGTWQDFTAAFGYYKSYFSKGIGLIKIDSFDGTGTLDWNLEIRRHQVF